MLHHARTWCAIARIAEAPVFDLTLASSACFPLPNLGSRYQLLKSRITERSVKHEQ
jgi:hypothetical protein